MTLKRKILVGIREKLNVDKYFEIHEDKSYLKDWFTSDELRIIADYMDLMKKNHENA